MWVLTLVCVAIPVVLYRAGASVRVPAHHVLVGVTVLIAALYVVIVLWMRPTAFVIDPDGLEITWPVRTKHIAASHIVRARVMTMRELKAELGFIMRVGAGGLFGGFGYAKTQLGLLELWVSRTDRIVYIECEGRRSLLITPEDPERFVRELPHH
jgi:hypothetical protein